MVVQPNPRVEIEWVRCLRVLQMVKEQAGPMLHALLTNAAASKLIDANPNHLHSILAPVKVIPILAFVFDDVRALHSPPPLLIVTVSHHKRTTELSGRFEGPQM